jgi:hypothetical protein
MREKGSASEAFGQKCIGGYQGVRGRGALDMSFESKEDATPLRYTWHGTIKV